MPDPDQRYDAISWLLDRSHLMSPDELATLADEGGRRLGASGCRVWLVSRDLRSLQRLPLTRDEPAADGLRLDGTLGGRSFRTIEIVVGNADGPRMWVPLVDGTERLGALELSLTDAEAADGLRDSALSFAGLLAVLLVSKGQYTDVFERVRRALPMGVAAETLWRQLPPLTFATDRFVVTAVLEPWYEVGGDAFDYSIDGDVLQLAVFDGMGHGLSATLLATVALAAYRNSRRAGLGLVATAQAVDAVLAEQFGAESFVTGVMGRLDLTTGRLSLLCAAHPAPLLIRDGRLVGEAHTDPGVPLGFGEREDSVLDTSLQPGDRLLLFSDGVIEARGEDGAFFGVDRLVDLLVREESTAQPPPETLRRLIGAVLEHQQGALQDDATLLLLEWAGNSAAVDPTG